MSLSSSLHIVLCVCRKTETVRQKGEEKRRREEAEIRHIYKRGNKCLPLVIVCGDENQYVQSGILTATCDWFA